MKSTKRLIVVLGMHRSGTSALTKGLEALGVHLGSDLMPPSPGNPKGYWEDLGFYDLNEALLKAIALTWDGLGVVEPETLQRLSKDALFDRAVALVRDRLGERALVGVKDPRFCLLLPFWEKVFATAGVSVSYIAAIRNPLSVAESLAQRNGMPKTQALWLWILHNHHIVANTAGVPPLVVDYDELLENPARQLTRVARFLNLPVDQEILAGFSSGFLDSSLRHTRYASEEIAADPACDPLVSEMHAAFRAQALADTAPEPEVWSRLAVQWQAALAPMKGLLNLTTVFITEKNVLAARIGGLEAEMGGLITEKSVLEQGAVRFQEDIRRLNGEVARLEGEVERRVREIQQVKQSLAWRVTGPFRFVWRHCVLRRKNVRLEAKG
jgi:hypothetical protein